MLFFFVETRQTNNIFAISFFSHAESSTCHESHSRIPEKKRAHTSFYSSPHLWAINHIENDTSWLPRCGACHSSETDAPVGDLG